jgi:apolipoprotein N-acyltransferase
VISQHPRRRPNNQQTRSVRLRRSLGQPVRYAVLLCGAIPVLAFPAANLEFLGWVGLVPGLALMQAAPSAREAAVRGWWFGAGYLLAAMYWLAPSLGPGLLLVAVVIGALGTAVGVAAWALLRPPVPLRRALAALVVVPSAWLVTEWLRSWQALGGPWAVLGTSQWQHPVFLALAAAGGVWLVTFALVLANTGVFLAIASRSWPSRVAGATGALVALLAGPVIFAATSAAPVTGQLTLALVQPGRENAPSARLGLSEQLTATHAKGAGLIVWGESSVGFDLDSHPTVLASIERAARAAGAEILAGEDAISPAGAKSKRAVLVDSTGTAGSYIKTRLVPFGEYIPLRAVLGWLTAISKAAPQNVVPGTGAQVLHARIGGGRPLVIGALICFESAFPDMARVDADGGAQAILYQTSDSTFQASWAPAQHAALGALRAAETGRPVAQAALTGDSAAFDDRGRLLGWAGTGFHGVLTVRLPLPAVRSRTLYDRLGDYVPWTAMCIAVVAALLALARVRRSRRMVSNGAATPTTVRIGCPPGPQAKAAREPGSDDARLAGGPPDP